MQAAQGRIDDLVEELREVVEYGDRDFRDTALQMLIRSWGDLPRDSVRYDAVHGIIREDARYNGAHQLIAELICAWWQAELIEQDEGGVGYRQVRRVEELHEAVGRLIDEWTATLGREATT